MPNQTGSSSIEVVTTPHGSAALAALRCTITDLKGLDPLAPVTVVVPNNFVGISARRGLASGDHGPVVPGCTGLAAVTFLTVFRLAELLGAPALALRRRRPVNTPLIAAAVRQVLAADPGVFGPVAQHPTTERRLVSAHRELSSLDPASLDQLGSVSQRARDVVRIHRGVTDFLKADWYGEDDLLVAARHAVLEASDILVQLGAVVLYLPEELSPGRAELLTALASKGRCIALVAVTGVTDADSTVHKALDRLGVTPSTVVAPQDQAPPRGDLQITSVSDADDEVRHVVRGIVDAARQGIRFDRMAVVYATADPYARLAQDHLDAAGVPYNGSAVKGLAESASGRLLRRLLELGDRGFRRADVTALLASSPLGWRGATVPSRAWDQISREAAVVGGIEDWAEKLDSYVRRRATELDRLTGAPEQDWLERRLRRQGAQATDLHAFVSQLFAELERGRSLRGWHSRSRWCRRLLRSYTGDQRDWPEDERRASERVESLLQRLGGLDVVEPDPSNAVFSRTLELELAGGLGRVGSFGNGVLVGHAWMCLGLELDRVWILGLSEGSFPSRPREDSLLPDRERKTTGVLPLRTDRLGDEHRHFLAAIAATAPDGIAHLMRPRGDLRQANERAPSRWLVELAEERVGRRLAGAELDHLDERWLSHVPSFAAGLLQTEFPPTVQEFDVRSLVDPGNHHGHSLLEAGGPLAAGVAAQAARDSDTFTRFDGNLTLVDLPDPTAGGRATSATALETYARCPFQYFMRYMLGVDPLETPEQRLRIDPISRGSLVHTILERFVAQRLETSRDRRWGWTREDREALHQLAGEEFAEVQALGLTGEPLFWRRDQVLLTRDLDAFLTLDTDRRIEHHLRPVATELGFGLRGAAPVELELPDSRMLTIRGSIDLVDEDEDSNLVVVDYKTGRETLLNADNPHHGGTKLQLVLYALAATELLGRPQATVTSLYWHLRARSNYRMVGYLVTPEIKAATLGAVATIVDGIGAGVFVQHPEQTTRTQWVSCHYCDPDGLGTSEARRRFVRKARAPELAAYLALAEPMVLPA